jgi:hypothetical protein
MIKSVANLLFLRGDGVYDLNAESLFADEEIYARNQPCNFKAQKDSHKMYGHEKVVSVLSNNQS